MGWAVGQVWRLCRGDEDELLGEIHLEDGDFPWVHGTEFRPQPAFAEVKPRFDEEGALADSNESVEAWEALYGRIANSLSLVAPDGLVAEFLLHIEDDEAWFRWSDEPFDDPQ